MVVGEIVADQPPLRFAVRAAITDPVRVQDRGAVVSARDFATEGSPWGCAALCGRLAGRVYRETIVESAAVDAPVVLVVAFRLRWVRGLGHAIFRAESLLNTPLFVGFPGFASKLWLAHDENGVYRGFYQWNESRLADAYVRALWWVLALVSEHDSIHYVVLPGLRRDDVLADPTVLADGAPGERQPWWRLVAVERTGQSACDRR